MSTLSTLGVSILNAFNAIYVESVDTKHIHIFLPITFLIFNQFSIHQKFWKAETEGFSAIASNTMTSNIMKFYTKYNTSNAMHVDTVDTFEKP